MYNRGIHRWSLVSISALAATATAGPAAAGRLDIHVGERKNADMPYIFRSDGARARPDARFVDTGARLTYAFRTTGLHRLVFILRLANNFRVQISNDGRRWQERLNAMRLFGRDRHDGAVAEYRVDASSLLPADRVFLRFLDASPLDGWGAYLAGIRIESDAPTNHDWVWRAPVKAIPGAIPEWALLGPFPAPDKDALLTSARASVKDAAALHPPAGGAWRYIRTAAGGRVDLLKVHPPLKPAEYSAVFAHVFIRAPRVLDARLLLGSDDGIAVWLNGAMILSHEVRRGWRDAQEGIPVRLGLGWNRLLLEIANGEGDWGFSTRLTDRSGTKSLDVRFQARNPLPDAHPFPVPRVPPEVLLLSAAIDPASASLDDGRLRIPLRVTLRNAGGALDNGPHLTLANENGSIAEWPAARIPSGRHELVLPLPRAVWEQYLLAAGGPLFATFGKQRIPLAVAAFQRLLGDVADSFEKRKEQNVPGDILADMRTLSEAARYWNAFDTAADEQREHPKRWFQAALDGAWDRTHAAAEALRAVPVPPSWTTTFQCAAPYDGRIDIQADAVMIYGLANTASRTTPWRRHGYRTQLMTGIAWGGYQDYLYGRFDGKRHLDDAQMNRRGERISHGGDVYYMVPTKSYTDYLCRFVEQSFDLPLDGICFEEPEFWMRGGWSPAFRREWQAFYGEPWQPPDSSYDACWRSGKLRKELYRRCLAAVCDFVKQHRPNWGCTVATHSLIHYSNIGIASPESALATLDACDTIIAQVWTDTILFPCTYDGTRAVRPFAMAYLEFAQMLGMITPTGKSLAFLADPVSDNPNRSWDIYRTCYEHTIVAGLQCGAVTRFEVMPWPDRVFTREYRGGNDGDDDATRLIPEGYATSLLATINALRHMPPAASLPRIGVGVSDSLMFQRGAVKGRGGSFDELYGLTLPLIQRGMLPAFVQLEHLVPPVNARIPDDLRVLLLTYDGQKPPAPAVHEKLAAWVRAGGVLIFFSDGRDPFARVREWWNDGGANNALPRDDLFRKLGIGAQPAVGWHGIGKGWFYYEPYSPAKFVAKGGDRELISIVRQASAKTGGIEFPPPRNWVAIERGPYLAASCWKDAGTDSGFERPGLFLDLFDDELDLVEIARCAPGQSGLWLDMAKARDVPGVLLSASRVTGWRRVSNRASYVARGPTGVRAVTWVRLPRKPTKVVARTQSGRPVGVEQQWFPKVRAVKIGHENLPDGVWIDLAW